MLIHLMHVAAARGSTRSTRRNVERLSSTAWSISSATFLRTRWPPQTCPVGDAFFGCPMQFAKVKSRAEFETESAISTCFDMSWSHIGCLWLDPDTSTCLDHTLWMAWSCNNNMILEKVLLDPIFMILKCELFSHFGSCFLKLHGVSTSQLEALVTWCFLSRELLRKQELVVDRGQLVSLFAVHWWGVFLCVYGFLHFLLVHCGSLVSTLVLSSET